MNSPQRDELHRLAQLIRRIQADGDVGPDDLAEALISQGVRVNASPEPLNEQWRAERVEQMLRYADGIMVKPGSAVTRAYQVASSDTRAQFISLLRAQLLNNPYFYLGMQTTGEMVRALTAVPELAEAYARLTPDERKTWLGQLRDAWHDFRQAATAFGLPEMA
ncbi:hypothetical protein [Deinococcus sp.]|uniref:hypothetical protein n=1 Tax=Deinococcus sp. TaxID=47478 RepID=UPI0025C5DD73|nr:hypothetical protein [Deinococcus sp.]